MKHYCIIILCIAIIFVGGYAEINYLEKGATFLKSDMDYIENALNNNNIDAAKEQIKKSYDSWNEMKNTWNVFILHDEVDDIDDSLIELDRYSKSENIEECYVAIEKIRKNIEHSVRRQKVKLDNIF